MASARACPRPLSMERPTSVVDNALSMLLPRSDVRMLWPILVSRALSMLFAMSEKKVIFLVKCIAIGEGQGRCEDGRQHV